MGIRYFFLCMYLRIMINPRCAAFILPQLCRVLYDSYTYSDWSPFWNQLKNEQLETDNYNCQISQIFLFL